MVVEGWVVCWLPRVVTTVRVGTGSGLTAELEYFDDLLVFGGVLLAQVAEEAAAAPNKLEQTATGVMVVFMNLEVLGEVLDASGEQTDLDTGRAGVVFVVTEFVDRFRIGGSGHVVCPNEGGGPERARGDRRRTR